MIPDTCSSIFPGLNPTAELQIADCLIERNDVRSIVVLSGVNKVAYEFFSNEEYFQQLFDSRYPKLTPAFFPLLCQNHPTNCWKLIACSSREGGLAVNMTFLKNAIPVLCEHLKKRKISADQEIFSIRGSCDKDTESPICKALKSYQQVKQELDQLTDFGMEEGADDLMERALANLASDHHPGEEGRIVANFLVLRLWSLSDGEEEELFAEAARDQVPLQRDLLSCYRNWCSYSQELIQKMFSLGNKYMQLGNRLQLCEADKKKVDSALPLLQDPLKWKDSKSIESYEIELRSEFNCGMNAGDQLHLICECIKLIDGIQEGQLNPATEAGNQIKNMILDTFSASLREHVRLELMRSCGDEKLLPPSTLTYLTRQVFSKWLTNHFPQCLGRLRTILSSIPKEVLLKVELY
jgi:hypothetical protein